MPLESIRFSNGTLPFGSRQKGIQGKYGLLRFSLNKGYCDSVSLHIHPLKYFLYDGNKFVPRGTPAAYLESFLIAIESQSQ